METKLRFTAGTVGRGGGGRGVVLVYRWLNLVGMILDGGGVSLILGLPRHIVHHLNLVC